MKNWIQTENKYYIILMISILLYHIFKNNNIAVIIATILCIIGIFGTIRKIYKDSKESKINFIMWIISFIISFCVYGLIYWFKK